MRHIPEEELHAYIDQALSRSQCVEIECHLAACVRCRHERDQIAALRDRTTALLGLVKPAHRPRPSYAELALRARGRHVVTGADPAAPVVSTVAPQRNWSRHGIRAAGFLLAIAAGWNARGVLSTSSTATGAALRQFAEGPSLDRLPAPLFSSLIPSAPNLAASTGEAPASEPEPGWRPDPAERGAVRSAPAPAAEAASPLALTVSTLPPADPASDFAMGGVWRTVSWSEAAALTGDAVPRIVGLPVVEIQMQRVGPEERPLLLVAQQDPSGRIIRTIEGPVQRVAELLAGEIARSEGAVRTSEPARSAPDYVGAATGTPRRSIRVMTVAGRLEADSLNQLARALTQR